MELLTTSIILCTRNRPDDIKRCLASIKAQVILPDQIIIVDSSDTSLNQLKSFNDIFSSQFFPTVQLEYLHTRPGLTYQRNRGIEKTTGDIIYFFDDDVILEKDYIQEMNEVFQHNPQYAAGMGDITNIDVQPSWKYQLFRKFFLLPRQRSSGKFTWSGMPTHPYGTKEFKKIEVLGGCCMAFRQNILKEFKFDEKLPGYGYMEDCDIAARISQRHQLFFNPRAQLMHLESPLARDKVVANSQMFMYNYSYLFFKNVYGRRPWNIIFYAWSIVGLFLEAILLKNKDRLIGFSKGIKLYYKG